MMDLRLGPIPLPPAALALQHDVRAFLTQSVEQGVFEPRCDSWLSGHSPEFSRLIASHGWVGVALPAQYGGGGRTAVERFVVVEELLAAGAPVAAHWIADRQSGPLIAKRGTEEQRLRFLPSIARGECFFGIGMSEPDSGSDLASVKTRATKVAGGWQVSGTKVWTSHAHRSHYLLTLCRTSADEDRYTALSQLIIDLHAPGVNVRPIRLLTGDKHFCEVILNDVFVPDDLLIGVAGNGWRQVTEELAFERSGPERFLSTFPLLLELVRTLGPTPEPAAAKVVGGLMARLQALRSMSLAVAARIDAGQLPANEAALVKQMGTEFERDVPEAVRLVVDLESAPSALRQRYEEAVLHAPGFTLRGGTTEILRGIVAKGLAAG